MWSKYSFCFSDPIHSLCKKRRKSCLGCAIYSYIQVKLSFNARVRVRYVQSRPCRCPLYRGCFLRLWLYFALNVRCERFSALYHVRYGQVWHYLGTFFIKAVDFHSGTHKIMWFIDPYKYRLVNLNRIYWVEWSSSKLHSNWFKIFSMQPYNYMFKRSYGKDVKGHIMTGP